ncbi:MAG: bifunctional glutamate N-acetyltransferase/amino-acid acetyltransferase ArgJ [Bacteroidota bacterium]
MLKEISNGITAPRGFLAAGVQAEIKRSKKDLAIIFSEVPAVAAGVFTLNKIQAAPVVYDKEQLQRSSRFSAIVVNSGNANACTGERGYQDTIATAQAAAKALHIPQSEVLISSTGVIGQLLPMEKILNGIQIAASKLRVDGSADAAAAIMTTDTYPKETAVEYTIGTTPIRIGCISKGSGMIAPIMALPDGAKHATMLAFITTDAAITPSALASALSASNEVSFNRLTVDGDTSTNDMALILANGRAGNPAITEGSKEFEAFTAALTHVLIAHAKLIARDGEGATKLIELLVRGAKTEAEAVRAARAIANSNLVKTAIHGADANWGRILAAVGYSGIDFMPESVQIFFNDLIILDKDFDARFSEEKAKEILQKENIFLTVNLNQGSAFATLWTCDLSCEYITINASYRS